MATDVGLQDGDVILEDGDVILEDDYSSISSTSLSSDSSSSDSSSSDSSSSDSSISLSSLSSSYSSSSEESSISWVSYSSSSDSSSSDSSSSDSSSSDSSESSSSDSSSSDSSLSSSSQSAAAGSKSSISSSSSSLSSDSDSSTSFEEFTAASDWIPYPFDKMTDQPSGSSSSDSSESSDSSSRSKTGLPVDIYQPDVGDLIILWELDLTSLGGAVYRFTDCTSESGDIGVAVTFDGETYYPREFDATGFGRSGKGQQPRPKIRIADTDNTIHDLCLSYQDMLKAVVRRKRTLTRYLDDGVQADGGALFPIDVYVISKKLTQTKIFYEFELNPYMDKEGKKVPARLVLKDICPFIYRRWNDTTSTFDYNTDKPCPYRGRAYFKRDGTATQDAGDDDCPRTLTACKLRYGDYGPLPFGGFPGMNRLKR